MSKAFTTQVTKKHYEDGYDSPARFISYFHQINLVKKLNPDTILEVGIGNKTVSTYLKANGYAVTTCDFAKDLKPDVLADVRALPFDDNSFDVVVACEILEHIPWSDFEIAVSELCRVSKRNVLISLPYYTLTIEPILHIFPLSYIIPGTYFRMVFRIPFFWRKFKPTNEHYWEMGWKHYSCKKIRSILKKFGVIKKEFTPELNPYHYFFLLEHRK